MAALLGGSALAGGLSGATAHKGKWNQISTMTPEQKQRASWAGNMGMQQIQNPYAGFDPIAKKAQSTFHQQTVPGLAERFTSMGSGSALSSPAFASQLSQAGGDLSESLAALMSQYGLQQQGLGQHLMGMGQTPQFENAYMSGGPSFLSGLFGGASQGMGSLGSAGLMGRYGGMNQGGASQDQMGQLLRMLQQRQ